MRIEQKDAETTFIQLSLVYTAILALFIITVVNLMYLIYKQNDSTSMYVWKQTIRTRSGITYTVRLGMQTLQMGKEEGEWAATVRYICTYTLCLHSKSLQ